jgi:hypothetical protein
MELNLPD